MSQRGNYKQLNYPEVKNISVLEIKTRTILDRLLGRNKPKPMTGIIFFAIVNNDNEQHDVISSIDNGDGTYILMIQKKEA